MFLHRPKVKVLQASLFTLVTAFAKKGTGFFIYTSKGNCICMKRDCYLLQLDVHFNSFYTYSLVSLHVLSALAA